MLRLFLILVVLGAAAPLFALSPIPDSRVVTSPNGQYRLLLSRQGMQSVYRVGEAAPLWSFNSADPGQQYFLSTDGQVVAEFSPGYGSSGGARLALRLPEGVTVLTAQQLYLEENRDGWASCTQQGNKLVLAGQNGGGCTVSLGDRRVIEGRRGGRLWLCGTGAAPEPDSDWLPLATYALLFLGAIYDIRRRVLERRSRHSGLQLTPRPRLYSSWTAPRG